LFFIKSGNFTPWNTSGDSNLSAIGGAMAICLFSYLGVETAAVAAAKVRNPERNVPKSTIYGTLASSAVYLLSMMICAEMPLAAAKGGLFPARFGRLSNRRVPAFGIISSTALASVAVVISYMGACGATVFTTLVLMTGITAAIPYAFSALAQMKWRFHDNQAIHTPRLVRDVSVAVVAFVFSLAFIYYSRNSGDTWYVVWGPFLMSGARCETPPERHNRGLADGRAAPDSCSIGGPQFRPGFTEARRTAAPQPIDATDCCFRSFPELDLVANLFLRRRVSLVERTLCPVRGRHLLPSVDRGRAHC
jgi:amino acid transporter